MRFTNARQREIQLNLAELLGLGPHLVTSVEVTTVGETAVARWESQRELTPAELEELMMQAFVRPSRETPRAPAPAMQSVQHQPFPADPCWCGVTHWDPGQ